MHKTLERQIQKLYGDANALPGELKNLFEAISITYQHFDEDRSLVERSLELSSRELEEVNQKLKEQNENLITAKSAIEQEAAKTEALLANMGDGVIATDKDGKILVYNQEAEKLLGWKSEEIVGKSWNETIKVRDEDGQPMSDEKQPMYLALSTRQKISANISRHYYYEDKDGGRFPIASTVSPILINNQVTGVINVFRDITKDTDVDRAKNEFVSLASHQLRTPLSTVKWYVELLLDGDVGKVNDDQKKYLEEIYTGNQRMIELVNALLNVSRIDLGTFNIDISPTDLKTVSDIVLHELEPQIKERVIRVEKTYAEDISPIPADPKLLKIILQNLISNSIKYTPPRGKVKVAIEKKGGDISITVSDTGYGIPKSQQSKVFSKLFRADNIREKDANGMGLGLYIVKLIVEQSGGRIWFESEEGKGTSFYVTIPITGMKKKEGAKPLD